MERDGYVCVVYFKRKREFIIDESTPNQYQPTRVPTMVKSTRERLKDFFPRLSNLLEQNNVVQISHPKFVVRNGDDIYPIKYLRFSGLSSTRIIWHEVNIGNQPVNSPPAPGPGIIQLLDRTNRVIRDLSEENQQILDNISQLGGSVPGNVATTASLKRYPDFYGASQQKNDADRRSPSTSSSDQTTSSDCDNNPSLFKHRTITPQIQLANDFFGRSFGFHPWDSPQPNNANQGAMANENTSRTFNHEVVNETAGYDSSYNTLRTANYILTNLGADGIPQIEDLPVNSSTSRQTRYQFPAHGSTNAFPIFKGPTGCDLSPDDIFPFTGGRTPQQSEHPMTTTHSISRNLTSTPADHPFLTGIFYNPLRSTNLTRTGQGTSDGFRNSVPTPVMANSLGILTPNPHHQFVSPLTNLYSMAGTPETEHYSGNYMADSSMSLNSNRKRPTNESDPTCTKRTCLPENPATGNFVFDTCSRNDPRFDDFDGTQNAEQPQSDGWRTVANTTAPPFFGAVNQKNLKVYFDAVKIPHLFLENTYGLPRQQNRGSTEADDGEDDALILPPDGTLYIKAFGLNANTGYATRNGNRVTFSRVDTEFLSNANFKNGICRVKAKWNGFLLHQGLTLKVDGKSYESPLEFKGPLKLRGELIMVQEGYEEGTVQQNTPTTSTSGVINAAYRGLYDN